MAETGTFRTGFGGFNKTDVLNYIDELKAAHAAELQETAGDLVRTREQLEESEAASEQNAKQLAELTRKCAEQEKALADAGRAAAELQGIRTELEILRRENRELKENVNGLRLLADDAAKERERLKALQAERDALLAEREREKGAREDERRRLLDQIKALQRNRQAEEEKQAALRQERDRAQELEKANRGYAALLGDVGAFILEIRSMGQRYLEESKARAALCLDAMDDAVAAVERQLGVSRQSVEEARQELEDGGAAAELRLKEWAEKLEKDAGALKESEAAPAPAACSEPARRTDESASFFR